jgi:hypothetical protein
MLELRKVGSRSSSPKKCSIMIMTTIGGDPQKSKEDRQ